MKTTAADPSRAPLTNVVLVGLPKEDEVALRQIFDCAVCPLVPGSAWRFHSCCTLQATLRGLHADTFPVVVCDHDFNPDLWRELLDQFASLPNPPMLIVASRLADERLWADALHRGAYDVLSKPFDSNELIRTISAAWLHWQNLSTLPLASTA